MKTVRAGTLCVAKSNLTQCLQNNIFLWRDDSGKLRAKIGDFGLSREASKVKPEGLATAPGLRDSGSKRFLSPEHLLPAPVPPPGQVSGITGVLYSN